MGKLLEFDISFTNNKVIYNPGESISGTLKVTLGQPLQYKAIKANCLGSCGVSSRSDDTSWAREEQYFSSTLSVADKGTLKQGVHTFPFQFLIPVAVPSSFEGPFGRVEYKLQAFIDTPRFAKDYKIQKPFTILNALNLNEVPDIERPSSSETSKKFSYLLVKTGTLRLKTKSDLRGYTPGQVIKLTAEIHNESSKETGCVLACLIQKVTYKNKKPLQNLRTIAEVEGPGVKGGKHAVWNDQILVPSLPQSGPAGCNLIDIDYYIQVSLKSPEVLVTLPIFIGNIPIDITSRTPTRPAPTARPVRTSRSAPQPAPRTRSFGVIPSAPSIETMGAVGSTREEISIKSLSHQEPNDHPLPMSPSAFRYVPGLPPSQSQPRPDAPGPLNCVSPEVTIPFFQGGNSTSVPTNSPLILPPEYSTWGYPPEPPPTYEQSCSNSHPSLGGNS